ncbi:hypothetical protein GLOTRDRAFT_79032 [Gloeophyllum trabeum ATCC 11539]|uniref:Uncharacterized protein n=1 Tax=Gloeophyllum trabeum (strain ATCC 11539 / FP-39264 / Madison 617) TaxID=670483 RepID=S7RFS1_GLOTA|nr:uncharacterized protein GLOTRDRAFT_79032 [Gloeophyllum trabeum ATCC 11539]EPQ53025.1 hypothetical protein GLOTRDRAFT_79032 [Gloeophyllum trabeum ATCC 11539]
MGQLPLEVANVLSVWFETLLYGIYFSLFFESVYVIMKKKRTKTLPAKLFFAATVVMFLLATVHIAISLYRLLRGYVWLASDPGPVAYFADYHRWDNVANEVISGIQTWIGDSLVIYRCFIVWSRNYYVVAVPSVLLVLSVIGNCMVFQIFNSKDVDGLFSVPLQTWVNLIYSATFAQNTLTTGFIAYRIWRQDWETRQVLGPGSYRGAASLLPSVRVIIESAMIYALEVLVLIILYAIGHNGEYVLQAAVTPTVGIVFTMITVRLALRSSEALKTTHLPSAFRVAPTGRMHLTTTINQSSDQELEESRKASGDDQVFELKSVGTQHEHEEYVPLIGTNTRQHQRPKRNKT